VPAYIDTPTIGKSFTGSAPPAAAPMTKLPPPALPQAPSVNPATGSVLAPTPGGAIDPKTGTVYVETPAGYVDPRTGQVVPRR
jgi:hypothetical protein